MIQLPEGHLVVVLWQEVHQFENSSIYYKNHNVIDCSMMRKAAGLCVVERWVSGTGQGE
jgi:hypothetical protein